MGWYSHTYLLGDGTIYFLGSNDDNKLADPDGEERISYSGLLPCPTLTSYRPIWVGNKYKNWIYVATMCWPKLSLLYLAYLDQATDFSTLPKEIILSVIYPLFLQIALTM